MLMNREGFSELIEIMENILKQAELRQFYKDRKKFLLTTCKTVGKVATVVGIVGSVGSGMGIIGFGVKGIEAMSCASLW